MHTAMTAMMENAKHLWFTSWMTAMMADEKTYNLEHGAKPLPLHRVILLKYTYWDDGNDGKWIKTKDLNGNRNARKLDSTWTNFLMISLSKATACTIIYIVCVCNISWSILLTTSYHGVPTQCYHTYSYKFLDLYHFKTILKAMYFQNKHGDRLCLCFIFISYQKMILYARN